VDGQTLLLAVVIGLALVFAWTNGFHDASNAVATSLATRSLTPRVALLLAAVLNLIGALLGEGLARLIGTQILTPPLDSPGLTVVLAALLSAIAWNLLTWWRGVPSSSSHALLGGLAGAGFAASAEIHANVLLTKVVAPLVLSPLIGFVAAWLLMALLHWLFRHAAYGHTVRRFRMGQTVSASAMALGHGLQDGQKTMGVMVLALVAAGSSTGDAVPRWVQISSAVFLALGTWAGGWRIIRTLSRRVVHVEPVTGFAAETVASGLLYTTAYVFNTPVSSTHTIVASIAGAGTANAGWRGLRWRVLRPIMFAWAGTLPATAAIAAVLFLALSAL
jgi:PiT family inorganic phosphate transporter